LGRNSKLGDQRRADLFAHDDQQQHHCEPLPSRSAKTLESAGKREEPAWSETREARRFCAGAQASHCKEAREQDFHEKCLDVHAILL
jgi:hypothetical protein